MPTLYKEVEIEIERDEVIEMAEEEDILTLDFLWSQGGRFNTIDPAQLMEFVLENIGTETIGKALADSGMTLVSTKRLKEGYKTHADAITDKLAEALTLFEKAQFLSNEILSHDGEIGLLVKELDND